VQAVQLLQVVLVDRWEKLGYIAAIFNPIPTGLVAGYFLLKDKKYRKTGKNVTILSILWLILIILITGLLATF
jgi:hypothetical protein